MAETRSKTFNVLELSAQDKPLSLWFNGADTYVARDVEHARALMLELLGPGGVDDVPLAEEWSEDKRPVLKIGDDDLGTREKTRDEWIRDNGPGFLCSTEW